MAPAAPPPHTRPAAPVEPLPLDGAHVLVVGGERGHGRAAVAGLARAGAHVAVAYQEDARGSHDEARRAEDLVTAAGRAGLLLPTDLTDPERCARLVADTQEHLGGLDVLVHAVAAGPGRALAGSEVPDAAEVLGRHPTVWRRALGTGLDSFVLVLSSARTALRGGGRVVVLAEQVDPRAVRLSDAATSGALLALVPPLAALLEPAGTRVGGLALAEGATATEVAEWVVRLVGPSSGAPAGVLRVGSSGPV